MFSGWVGDQDPTFDGFQNALRNMFHSAWRNYLNFGSDTAGYRNGKRTKALFLRWAQVNTFMPLFENGGDNNHGPWSFDLDTVNIYRTLVEVHMELKSFFLTNGNTYYAAKKSPMKPLARDTIFTPDNWDFLMGETIFVAPILNEVGNKTVTFPGESGTYWVDYYTNTKYAAKSTVKFTNYPLWKFTVYRKSGSVLPLQISSDNSLFGDSSYSDALTLLMEGPVSHEKLTLFEYKIDGLVFEYNCTSKNEIEMVGSEFSKPVIILIRGEKFQNLNSFTVYDHIEKKRVESFKSSKELTFGKQFGWTMSDIKQDPTQKEILIRISCPFHYTLVF